MAALVSGPRRRAAVANAAAKITPGVCIRVVDRAWTVSERTGRVTVCRTVDQLLDALERRGTRRAIARSALLDAAAAQRAP
jgi:hypothetical protein